MAACFSNRINLFPLRSLYPHLLIGYKMIGAETSSKTLSQSGVAACVILIVLSYSLHQSIVLSATIRLLHSPVLPLW